MRMEPRGLAENKLSKRKGEPLGRTHYGRTGDTGETLFAETKAASEGEAGTAVPVLRVVRPDLSARHTGRGLAAGACQSWRSGRGRRLDRPDRSAGNGRERVLLERFRKPCERRPTGRNQCAACTYRKPTERRRRYPNEKFDFLGYGFQPRRSKNRFGKYFINFSPAISDEAGKAIREEIRSWDLHLRSDKQIEDLSRMFNPKIRGWLLYYGRYYRSALYPYMRQLDRSLARWAYRKYKKLRGHLRRATHWIARISRRDSKLFARWRMGVRRGSMAGAV